MTINEHVKSICEEYGIEKENVEKALFKFILLAPMPYAVLEIARKQTNLSSIAELLLCRMFDDYLLEDEADEIEIGENEFIVRDYSLKDFGIKPGDIVLYNPERTDETVYFSAVDIDGCVFPADLNEDEEDPEKYCICTNGAYWDFSVYKEKVKVLGEIYAWRHPNENNYRPFIEE